MPVDQELERLLEEFDLTSRRLETRKTMLEEALVELTSSTSLTLEGYMGFGRTFRVDDGVREALRASAKAELDDLYKEVQTIREAIIGRRTTAAIG